MTETLNNPGSSKNSNEKGIVDFLVQESKRFKNRDEFIAFLVSQMSSSSTTAGDIEYTVGALRAAVGEYLRNSTSEAVGLRCNFCGKSQHDVPILVASSESAICDNCVFVALETIIRKPRRLHLRIAYVFFEAIAAIGYKFFSFSNHLRRIINRKNEHESSGRTE